MNNFVNQLQELTKTAVEQQEKVYQLEQQAKKERAIQDSNNFFNEYFSEWLIELANQGLSYILCRLDFKQNRLHSIIFSKETTPKSREKFKIVLFDATPPYFEFQAEDFLNIADNQNFSMVSYHKDINYFLTYFFLISWGTCKYDCALEALETIEEEFGFPPLKKLKIQTIIRNEKN